MLVAWRDVLTVFSFVWVRGGRHIGSVSNVLHTELHTQPVYFCKGTTGNKSTQTSNLIMHAVKTYLESKLCNGNKQNL